MANMPIIRFNKGEITPKADARDDTEMYEGGCRHLENLIPLIYGCAERRPGTKSIHTYTAAIDSGKIQISTLAELALIGVDEDYPLDGDYELIANIDASDTSTWDDESGFTPIGDANDPFCGTFDGLYHTISDLYISRSAETNQGLFGFTSIKPDLVTRCVIKNLRLVDCDISGTSSVGSMIGYATHTDVSKCFTSGTVTAAGHNAGGFVGGFGSDTFEKCGTTVNVHNTNSLSVHIGGFAGAAGGTFDDCYAQGNITCAAATQRRAGGFHGDTTSAFATCYSTGSVPTEAESYPCGGFIGRYDLGVPNATFDGCYWDTTTSGYDVGAGGNSPSGLTGKTTAQMKREATFTDWDFDDVWKIDEGVTYPTLQIDWVPYGKARLIPFIYSSTIAYVVEVSDRMMQFYYNDALLVTCLDTPYIEAHLFELHFKQIADTMWITHSSYAPRKLIRTSATSFSLDVIEFNEGPFLLRNDLIDFDVTTTALMNTSVTALDATGTLTFDDGSEGLDYFESGHIGALFKLVHARDRANMTSKGTLEDTATGVLCAAIDVRGNFKFTTSGNWDAVTILQRNENGAGWEDYRTYVSKRVHEIGSKNVQVSFTENAPNVQYRAYVSEHVSGDVNADITIDGSMQTGIVRITGITSTTVATIKVLATIAATDQTRRWAEGAWSAKNGYPSSVTFFEERCIYGGMSTIPTQWISS